MQIDLRAVFFHGTRDAGITRLRPSTGGEFGPGIYLTSFGPTAQFYAQHVARGPDAPAVLRVRTSVSRPFEVTKSSWVKMTERSSPSAVQKRLRAKGYDSIVGIANNGYEWQLVVFDPESVALEETPAGAAESGYDARMPTARVVAEVAEILPAAAEAAEGDCGCKSPTKAVAGADSPIPAGLKEDALAPSGRLTIAQAQAELARHGIVLRKKDPYGDFRVNFRGGDEATAYYTTDLDDALATGLAMARQRGGAEATEAEGEIDPAGQYAQIQRMLRFFVSNQGLGQYVPNSAVPTGQVTTDGHGIWSFYTRLDERSGAQRREVDDGYLRQVYRQRGMNEASEAAEAPQWVPPQIDLTPIQLETLLGVAGWPTARVPPVGTSVVYDRDGYRPLSEQGYIVIRRATPGTASFADHYVLTDKGADVLRQYRLYTRSLVGREATEASAASEAARFRFDNEPLETDAYAHRAGLPRGHARIMWVANLPGHGGVDWGYTQDPKQAMLISPYWQRRFKTDMYRVGSDAIFVPPTAGGARDGASESTGATATEYGVAWQQRRDGVWMAKGSGGIYYMMPTPSGMYRTIWMSDNGNQQDLGTHSFAGGAQAVARHVPYTPSRASILTPDAPAFSRGRAAEAGESAWGMKWERSGGGTGWRGTDSWGTTYLLRQAGGGQWNIHVRGRQYGPYASLDEAKRAVDHTISLDVNEAGEAGEQPVERRRAIDRAWAALQQGGIHATLLKRAVSLPGEFRFDAYVDGSDTPVAIVNVHPDRATIHVAAQKTQHFQGGFATEAFTGAAGEAYGPKVYVPGDKFVAVAVDHRGMQVGRWAAPTRASAMAMADAGTKNKETRVTVRTDHTSDGTYFGPGGGRVVAQREHGRWIVDPGDSTTHPRALEAVAGEALEAGRAGQDYEVAYYDPTIGQWRSQSVFLQVAPEHAHREAARAVQMDPDAVVVTPRRALQGGELVAQADWDIHIYDPATRKTRTERLYVPNTRPDMGDSNAATVAASRRFHVRQDYILALPHRERSEFAGSAGEAAAVVPEGSVCRPWVRMEKDPQAFNACMALAEKVGPIEGHGRLYEIVRQQMQREDQEVFYAIVLDTHLGLRAMSEISRGGRDRVPTPMPDLARMAAYQVVHYGGMGLAIAHCHPSGKPRPSDADKQVTKAVEDVCSALGIMFVDHLVVGAVGHGYYSFRKEKIFRPKSK